MVFSLITVEFQNGPRTYVENITSQSVVSTCNYDLTNQIIPKLAIVDLLEL